MDGLETSDSITGANGDNAPMDNAQGNENNQREEPENRTQSEGQYQETCTQGNEGEENVHTVSNGIERFLDAGNNPARPEVDVNNSQPAADVTGPPIHGSPSDFDRASKGRKSLGGCHVFFI
ncbi:hypothetical protein KC19_VG076100 [Ceratodon purpureus]|uniref:Uncharacterized protein n=1 Tax=Ceratodon purpureus TaxID=3225 RepID=A0A8T0HN53_CERPU|nr:hypothetical protein KC19_VG076100 [Ceratodon purpureus]